MKSNAGNRPALRRETGLLDVIGTGLGAVVMGAGIFVVTGVAAGVAGAAFPLGWR